MLTLSHLAKKGDLVIQGLPPSPMWRYWNAHSFQWQCLSSAKVINYLCMTILECTDFGEEYFTLFYGVVFHSVIKNFKVMLLTRSGCQFSTYKKQCFIIKQMNILALQFYYHLMHACAFFQIH